MPPVRRVTVGARDGARIVWHCEGTGEPVLLLHGGMGSWNHWIRNIGVLAQTYQVLAVDMPGYGDSDSPVGGDSPADLAASLAEGLDALIGADRPYRMAAFSFGGTVAAHLLRSRPERVRGLLLVGAAGLGVVRPGPVRMERWRGIADADELAAVHRRNLARLMLSRAERVDDEAVRLHAANLARGRVSSVAHSLGDGLRQALSATSTPLAGIWGELDPTTPRGPSEVAEIFSALRGDRATLVTVPDAGHWVQYEAWPRVNPLMLAALAGFS